ncbi:DNA-methyltransferase [Actinobacillus delphinicola]|uniref:Methyltransferase n=1 Tax=Actinobacillus delphinicola TaxID=51161 RepID=A0A448TVV1_9PAST|nr:site-specific DNA-methyltransferase [Actinobacillus delphinicola]VEJ10054.1 Modification methylase HindIII [Actinobacillus delphinicola]
MEKITFNNQIISGNSIELIKKIESRSVHAIISDIPYGIGYDSWDVLHNNTNSALGGKSIAQEKCSLFKRRGKPLNGWSAADKLISHEYQLWVTNWAAEWLRVLKPGASVFIFAGRQFTHRVIIALEDAGFTFKDMLSWERDRAPHRAQRISKIYERRGDLCNAEKWNSWRVANLRPIFEPILWFQKPYKLGDTLSNNVINYEVGAWNENALSKYNINPNTLTHSNMLKILVESNDRGLHPTQKPLNLMKLLIELVTLPGQNILDPFAGSGTTILASKILNRNGVGFELNSEMVEIANNRIKNI